jgi:hypothetical protein
LEKLQYIWDIFRILNPLACWDAGTDVTTCRGQHQIPHALATEKQ